MWPSPAHAGSAAGCCCPLIRKYQQVHSTAEDMHHTVGHPSLTQAENTMGVCMRRFMAVRLVGAVPGFMALAGAPACPAPDAGS